MIKSRVLEERLIRIYKLGESFFWIGGPGEEAFGVPLGLLVNKGQGPDFDYLHLHYRCSSTLIALGMPMIDSVRLMMNRATDVSTGGRNFANHYCYPEWNVAPVSSPIEVQYSIAIGTAIAQRRRRGSKAITIVTGGDAGTAEGDFASALVWASRKRQELPMLLTVQNNRWGISTDYNSQHGEVHIADRGKAFGMRTAVVDGNDPEQTYFILKELIEHIRKTGRPVLAEFTVSRLYGHSSASGANRVEHEEDCVLLFQDKLLRAGVIKEAQCKAIWAQYENEVLQAVEIVRQEPSPNRDSIWNEVYAGGENADWRRF